MILFVEEDYESLISDSKYIESMKKHICEILCLLDNQHITDEHLRSDICNIRFENLQKHKP